MFWKSSSVRFVGLAWLAMILVAEASAFASGLPKYSLTDLGPLAGADANSINVNGQVVGEKDFGSGTHAFLYSGGTTHDLGTLSPTQSYSNALAVNASGQIVGISQQTSTSGSSFPFVYSGGTMTEVPGLGGNYYGSANAINDLGEIVGISGRPDHVTHAFLYSGGTTTDLTSLTGSGGYSDAYGINNAGQITGVSDLNGHDRGFIWQNGTMTDIGDLYGGSAYARAYAINNLGQIIGESWPNSSSPTHAFIWQSGSMTDLGVLPGTNDSIAEGINDSGLVVGTSQFSQDPNSVHRMFVWDNSDGIQDVNSLLDASGVGWTLYGARDINDNGQIVGWGVNQSGQVHGVVLTPTPELSSLVLLAPAALGLLGYASRRRIARRRFRPSNIGQQGQQDIDTSVLSFPSTPSCRTTAMRRAA